MLIKFIVVTVSALGQSAIYGMMCQYVLKAISPSTQTIMCFNMYTSTASTTRILKCGIFIITTMYDNDGYLFWFKLCIPNQSHPYWNQIPNCTIFILWDTWHAFECIMHSPQNLPEGNYLLLLIPQHSFLLYSLKLWIRTTDERSGII